MRIAILSTILATAATLAACSSGGPGSLELSALDLGREPVSDGTFGAPYEPPPNRAGSIPTDQDPTKPPKTSTSTDPPSPVPNDRPVTSDSGGGDSGLTKFDAGIQDAGGATCTDLDVCCAGMDAGTIQNGCDQVVASGNNASCASALNSYKQAGYCM